MTDAGSSRYGPLNQSIGMEYISIADSTPGFFL
jgi:hypothetical protein